MSSYRRQLKRDRATRILDRQVGAPVRRIRPGEEITDAKAGDVFEVVVDNDVMPGVIVAGRVRADGDGTLRVDPVLRAELGQLTTRPVGSPSVDELLEQLIADGGRGEIPGHPACKRLP